MPQDTGRARRVARTLGRTTQRPPGAVRVGMTPRFGGAGRAVRGAEGAWGHRCPRRGDVRRASGRRLEPISARNSTDLGERGRVGREGRAEPAPAGTGFTGAVAHPFSTGLETVGCGAAVSWPTLETQGAGRLRPARTGDAPILSAPSAPCSSVFFRPLLAPRSCRVRPDHTFGPPGCAGPPACGGRVAPGAVPRISAHCAQRVHSARRR